MTQYARGRAFEYQVKKELEAQGYYVLRSAGSHSKIDLFAMLTLDNKELPLYRAIQCKLGNSPYKADLQALKALNLPAQTQKEIWIKKPRQPVKINIL